MSLGGQVRGVSFQSDTSVLYVTLNGIVGRVRNQGPESDSLWKSPFGLQDIDMISNKRGFSCGDFGTILKTTNGGTEWSQIVLPGVQNLGLTDITFLPNGLGLVVGQNGRIFQSLDSGETWINHSVSEIGTINKAYLADTGHCFLLSKSGIIYKFGWNTGDVFPLSCPISASFLTLSRNGNMTAGYVTPPMRVYYSSDWGQSWSATNGQIPMPPLSGSSYYSSFSLGFSHKNQVVYIGGRYQFRSLDYGGSFSVNHDYKTIGAGLMPRIELNWLSSSNSLSQSFFNFDTLGNSVVVCGNGGIFRYQLPQTKFFPMAGTEGSVYFGKWQEKEILFTGKSFLQRPHPSSSWNRLVYFDSLKSDYVPNIFRRSDNEFWFSYSGTHAKYNISTNGLTRFVFPYTNRINQIYDTPDGLATFGQSSIVSQLAYEFCFFRYSQFLTNPITYKSFTNLQTGRFQMDGNGFGIMSGGNTSLSQTYFYKTNDWGKTFSFWNTGSNVSYNQWFMIDSLTVIFKAENPNRISRTQNQFNSSEVLFPLFNNDSWVWADGRGDTLFLVIRSDSFQLFRTVTRGNQWEKFTLPHSNYYKFNYLNSKQLTAETAFHFVLLELPPAPNIAYLENKLMEEKSKFFPNPCLNVLKFLGTGIIPKVQIYDVNGKLLIERSPDSNGELDFKGYLPGLYLLKWIDGQSIKTQKVVKL